MSAPLANLVESALESCASAGREPINRSGAPLDPAVVASRPAMEPRLNPADYYSRAGIAMVGVLVDASGNGRFAHVIGLLSSGDRADLTAAALRFARASRYLPGKVDGKPVTMWKPFVVSFGGARSGHTFPKADVDKWRQAAREGDATAIATLTSIYRVSYADAPLPPQEIRHLIVQGALLGLPDDQVDLARLLRPEPCHSSVDLQKVHHDLVWGGNSRVALEEAVAELQSGAETDIHSIATLLHGAAQARDGFVQMWAAGLLATAPIAGIRDPETALAVALTLPDVAYDPDYAEVLAAAQAATGHFDEAMRVQRSALAMAKKQFRDDAHVRRRLDAYRSGQPWIGYLCDCARLLPDR